ncbi:MAG: hypothetical protein ACSHW0_14490 [Thalassotalea sp.]
MTDFLSMLKTKECLLSGLRLIGVLTLLFTSSVVLAQEKNDNELTAKKSTKKTAYVIETLVQGSQEQPNVIYITPWQEQEKTVTIEGQSLQISLPELTPVNPKAFKKKLHRYYQ